VNFKLIILVILIVLGVAIFIIPGRENYINPIISKFMGNVTNTDSTGSPLKENSDATKKITDSAKNVAQESVNKATSAIGGTIGNISKGVQEKISSTVKSITDALKEKAKTEAVKQIDSILGIETSPTTNSGTTLQNVPQGGDTIPSPITYLAKIGSTTSFSIRVPLNNNIKTFDLLVDWGDGEKEERKSLNNNQDYLLSHTWGKIGAFDFQFKVVKQDKAEVYVGSVTVTK